MRRLDQILVEKNLVRSREQAKERIKSSKVSVNGKIILKPSFLCGETDRLEVFHEEDTEWVSRSGEKLNGALEKLGLSLQGQTCLDVGQSTGGFTQAMLLKGALKVVGVDVGKDQLALKLRDDSRVECFESTDARDLKVLGNHWNFDFFAVDVSFISVLKLLSGLEEVLKKGTVGIFLIKPQFEVGKKNVKKGGLVEKPLIHLECEKQVLTEFNKRGIKVWDYFPTNLKGKNGNQEFICYVSL